MITVVYSFSTLVLIVYVYLNHAVSNHIIVCYTRLIIVYIQLVIV